MRPVATASQIPLPLHTTYAELVERAHLQRLVEAFDDPAGNFVRKHISGRDYWYFRHPMRGGERARDSYVGPDSPALQGRIAAHRSAKDDRRQRRSMVTALLAAGLRGPDARTGRVLEALADAGVFRMRAVLVGTSAYQTYSGLLGVKLTGTYAQTDDLDLAQFRAISIAVQDSIEAPLLEILQRVDPQFRPVPDPFHPARACSFAVGDRYRVDILTPNRGPDSDAPVALPALQADAQPLRYLDFLIYREVQAVALYGTGVPINVPAPERYCLHKLIVSRARLATAASQVKAGKDLRQAGELLHILCDQRPYEIRDLWEELLGRGPKWRARLGEAVQLLDAAMGDRSPRTALESLVGRVDAPS